MYLNFYNLKKQPFHITPDPEFLYLSPSHKEALAAIIYGIEEKKGFVAIIGAVGAGKTTILRSYLERADKKHLKIIYIFNPRLTFDGLLENICQELGLPVENNDVPGLINKLYTVLIEEYKEGNTVVLVVDEAQNMPIDTLESLRMFSNLETSKDKLIQIVLVGQPEFETTLNLDKLRQLKQRLAIRSTILPLTKEESLEYIKFRLRKAGSDLSSVFTASSIKKIIRKAHGVPRVINVLCDNALITGFGYQQKPVMTKIVGEIIRDLEGTKRSFIARWWAPVAVALSILILIMAIWAWPRREVAFHKMGGPLSSGQNEVPQPEQSKANAEKLTEQRPLQAEEKQPIAIPKKERLPVIKKVNPGDTLTKLADEVYGKSGSEVLGIIRDKNPQITNPNLIQKGSTITFPDLPERE